MTDTDSTSSVSDGRFSVFHPALLEGGRAGGCSSVVKKKGKVKKEKKISFSHVIIRITTVVEIILFEIH